MMNERDKVADIIELVFQFGRDRKYTSKQINKNIHILINTLKKIKAGFYNRT